MGETIAIITARGGSKRIPRKNIRDFLGKPIMGYSIEAALTSGIFDEVMVSTDDNEIAEVAKRYGAVVPFLRSDVTSSDFATTAEVLIEVLEKYKLIGKSFDYACCCYPTAPFITKDKLVTAYEMLKTTSADSVIPVTKYNVPVWHAMKNEEEFISYQWPEYQLIRTQDLPISYFDVGQFYFFKVANFLRSKTFLTDKVLSIVVPESEVQDIDNEEDWLIAEIKYTWLKNTRRLISK